MFERRPVPDAATLAASDDAALSGLLLAADQERSRLAALSARVVAELRRRRIEEYDRTSEDGSPYAPGLTGEQVLSTELAALLRIAESTAHARISEAVVLTEELPATLEVYERGDLHVGHVKAITHAAAQLTERVQTLAGVDEDPLYAGAALTRARAELEKMALEGVEKVSVRQLRRRLGRALERLSTGYVRAVKEEREQERFLRIERCDDGVTAHLSGNLPLADAIRLDAYLTRCADAANPQAPRGVGDDGRSHAARRVDALLDLADLSVGTAAAPAPCGVEVLVTVAATTLLGLDDEPGEVVSPVLGGLAAVPADVVRELAGDATWRRMLTDTDGHVLAVGSRTYRPSAALARLVRARHPTCVFPGCSKPSSACDLDHLQPFDHHDPDAGGLTVAENLAPECRFHHRIKTHTRWRVIPRGRGLRWTSPSGSVHDTGDPPPF